MNPGAEVQLLTITSRLAGAIVKSRDVSNVVCIHKLPFIFFYCYIVDRVTWRFAECHFAECQFAKWQHQFFLFLAAPFSKMTFGELTFGEMPFREMTFGELTFGEMAFGEMTFSESSGHCT